MSEAIIKAIIMLTEFEAFLFSRQEKPPECWKNEDGMLLNPINEIRTQFTRLKQVLRFAEGQITGVLDEIECLCAEERALLAQHLFEKKLNNNQPRENHPAWKTGKHYEQGYIVVKLHPDDSFYDMQKGGGYVKEHRLVIAKSLGRCLKSWEIVHHINHIKDDNRLENLQLVSCDRHMQIMMLERKILSLEERIKTLEERQVVAEAESLLLRQQVEV